MVDAVIRSKPARYGRASRGNPKVDPDDRARILRAIATARAWTAELESAAIGSPAAIAAREQRSERSVRTTLSLAQLSPTIVRTVVDGKLRADIGIRDLAGLPSSWAEQERALGL